MEKRFLHISTKFLRNFIEEDEDILLKNAIIEKVDEAEFEEYIEEQLKLRPVSLKIYHVKVPIKKSAGKI